MAISSTHRPLNATTFVTLGEGLAAGAGDFGLSEQLQPFSFPAQFARQVDAAFSQPLIEAPGIGPAVGFPELPVIVPQAMQTTVLKEFPPPGPFSNLSVPGLTLADAMARRPVSPLVHRSDALQTAVNFILGLPGLMMGGPGPLPTQLEYALFRQPTLVLIALGYAEALDAVQRGDAGWLPGATEFRTSYGQLLQAFAQLGSTPIVATIPDPADTAGLVDLSEAGSTVKAEPGVLMALFNLDPADRLTPTGLIEAGSRLIMRQPGPLSPGSVVPGPAVEAIGTRIQTLNAEIAALGREHEAVVFDLHGLLHRIGTEGVEVGGRRLTARYLGGFYSLNGVYPGATGHGAIANGLIDAVNAACGTSYVHVDLEALAAGDPVADYRGAAGPSITAQDLAAMPPPAAPPPAAPPPAAGASAPPSAGGRLTLPPGREQVLPISSRASYLGDVLRAVHTRDERDLTYGSTPNLLFGGHCIVQSHLHGSLRITFSEPEGDITHFEISHGDGLTGDDEVLVAPQFFRLPCLMNTAKDFPGTVSSGDLNLATGEVTNLAYNVAFANSALFALVSVNPKLPAQAIGFPGQYGSAWARFEQRADGLLDFSFSGRTFLPLGAGFGGDPVRFPLPFAGPSMEFASIPAHGTALHPTLTLSTKEPEAAAAAVPEIPTNTVREYTAHTHNTAFGDVFTLNIPELGGGATGRSHLLGRVILQFGGRTGDSVPFTVSTLVPGGMLARPPDSPMAKMFPGRLSLGLLGHDEVLRFPQARYSMHEVCYIDDPFEFAIGAIDLKTGRVIGDLLYRGFIIQDMLLALMQLEPRTPKSTFFFRGRSAFETDANGQTVFGFAGTVRIPYPEGFGFPRPDLRSTFRVGANSALDPYLYIQATPGHAPAPAGKSGSADNIVASNDERFSYRYAIPGEPAGKLASFEYVNHTKGATFQMGSLLWVGFMNSDRRVRGGEPEIVSFTGMGRWSADQAPHVATVQISTARDRPYVSILIDGGMTSNVNTKPAKAVVPQEGLEL